MQVYRFDMLSKSLSKLEVAASAARHEIKPDSLFVVSGTELKALGGGAVQAGTWRSRRFASPYANGFGWFKLGGSPAATVCRFYVDGVLRYTTPTVADREPRRLPAVAGRWWEVEVEGVDRITSVSLAESSEELVG
jgi:hypothetical protein